MRTSISRSQRVVLAATCAVLTSAPAFAVDLAWLGSGLIYDLASSWSPAQIPTSADNALFNLDVTSTAILGAASQSLDVRVSAGTTTLTGGSGATLNTARLGLVDNPSAGTISLAARTTLQGARWFLTTPSADPTYGDHSMIVGQAGAGRLDVTAGSVLRHRGTFVGRDAGSHGQVAVSGAGTLYGELDLSNQWIIGGAGTGTVDVSGGARVNSSGISVGFGATGVGTLSLDGANTLWAGEVGLTAGGAGTGALTVSNGARLQLSNLVGGATISPVNANNLRLGEQATGAGVADFRDASTTGLIGWDALIGVSGAGSLTVRDAAVVETRRTTYLGFDATGEGRLSVDGPNSAYNGGTALGAATSIAVGRVGKGLLSITNGGRVSVPGFIDIAANLDGATPRDFMDNRVLVSGAGGGAASALSATSVRVGLIARGSLRIEQGGAGSAAFLRVGDAATGRGRMEIDGAGSRFTNTTDAVVGVLGVGDASDPGGRLALANGGQLTSPRFAAGFAGNATGIVSVDGADSILTVNGDLDIGFGNNSLAATGTDSAATGTLLVSNGGRVVVNAAAPVGLVVGRRPLASGHLTVTDPGSVISIPADRLSVGDLGRGAALIANGGRVESFFLVISDTSSATVGERSLAIDGFLGNGLDGTFGTDDDIVSLARVDRGVSVGEALAGSLTLRNGGRMLSGVATNDNALKRAIIGSAAAADGAVATVTGANSRWIHNGYGVVGSAAGNLASPSRLDVLNGGYAEFTYIEGASSDGSRGVILVDGPGSLLRARDARGDAGAIGPGFGDMRLIPAGSNGSFDLAVRNAGRLALDASAELGRGDAASPVVATIEHPGSAMDVGLDLFAAYAGSNATLSIRDGGRLSVARHAYLSFLSGAATMTVGSSVPETARVDVVGSLTLGGTDIADGAGAGILVVNAGGEVNVGANLVLWTNSAVVLSGGTINAGSLILTNSGALPVVNFASGTFRFSGNANLNAETVADLLGANPTLTPGRTLAVNGTNTLSTPLRLNGGTLASGAITPASLANLDFDAGTFNLTATDLLIGDAGLFGAQLELGSDQAVGVTQSTTIDADGRLVVAGRFASGSLTNNHEIVAIGATLDAPLFNAPGSSVTVVGDVLFAGPVSGPGLFYGPGTASFADSFAPGASPALVGFEGNVALAAASRLQIELGGTARGIDHDALDIAGALSADGTLAVQRLGSFIPVPGTVFDIVHYASRSGDFAVVNETGLAGLRFDHAFGTDALTLTADAVVDGDANLDARVDVTDLGALASNWQGSANWLGGDFTGDGFVDVGDLGVLATNWQAGVTGPTAPHASLQAALSSVGLSGAVPEPAGLAGFAIASALVSRRRR